MATQTPKKKPTTLYRDGSRDDYAREGKNAAHRSYRRSLADAAFGPAARDWIIEQVASGVPLPQAVEAMPVGLGRVSVVQVHGRARWDPDFRRRLDDALDAYSAPYKSDKCGTPTGYRNGCRCRPCRTAHAQETGRYR